VENKNNSDLALGAMLVAEGWFEAVSFLYGPVGHTHNKIDAIHNVHNEVGLLGPSLACSFTSCLLKAPMDSD
jgi:hypothetical protein